MKKLTITLMVAAAALVASCNNHDDKGPENSPSMQAMNDSLKSTGHDMKAEMEEYRMKINNRLEEMRLDIEAARARRKAEKDLKKQREYDMEIENKENNRRTLQEKLDRMGNNLDAEWDKFKREVDDFFTNDHTTYKHRNDSI